MRSTEGKNGDRWVLLPRLLNEDVGIAAGWNDRGVASVTVHHSVIERVAPGAFGAIEQLQPRWGSTHYDIIGELLDALTEAYREAAAR